MKRAFLVTFLVLLADQALKVWVKTHFFLGEYVPMFGEGGTKAYLQFVENDGMAFGLRFGGAMGKLLLTLFRMVAVSVIGVILFRLVRQKREAWLITSLSLIFAGALGNIIDSAFYGLIFDKGTVFNAATGGTIGYQGLAAFGTPGYSSFLHGSVVDMFYFPLWEGRFPQWLPIWGNQHFEFFRPVFNIADAAISVGVAMMIFMRRNPHLEQPASAPLVPQQEDVNRAIQADQPPGDHEPVDPRT